MSNLSANEQLRMSLTPGLMAVTASRGRWVMARHLALIDEEIRRLVLREVPERVLVIRLPPRHGKSELVSHWTPTWFESNWPEKNTLLASYEADYAATWGRKSRDRFIQITGDAGCVLPGRIATDRQANNNWGTTAGGYMATAGVGGPFTGKGFHLGICDDLIKNAEQAQSETYRNKTWDWLTSTFWSRREPEGVMVVVGTPWHRDDYLARLRTWGEPVREVCLPALAEVDDVLGRRPGEALWPMRFDESELKRIRLAQGPYYWSALYQQRPTLHEQAEWPGEYFEDIWVQRMPHAFEMGAIGMDPSKGRERGDYAANVFAGISGGHIYVDSLVERMPAEKIVRTAANMATRYSVDVVGVESVQFQELLAAELVDYLRRNRLPAFPVEPLIDMAHKHIRIRRLGGWLAQRRIKFLDTPSNRLLVQQLQDFPLGDHDDGPDALEMAIRMLSALCTATEAAGEFVEEFA